MMARVYLRQVFGEGNIEADGYELSTSGHTIHESDPDPQSTGLVDHRGHKIMAVTSKNPIGFGHVYES